MTYHHVTIFFCCLVGLCLSAGMAQADKLVVLNDKGQLLDLSSERVKALAKEKMRVTRIKKEVIETKLPPQEMVRRLFEPIVEPNKEQYEQSVRNAKKFQEMAQQAADRDQEETAQKYMRVAKLFYEYSLRNKKIVTAFASGASGEISQACEDILNIEKEIQQIARKDVPRDWLTPQEVNSVYIMSEKQYENRRRLEEDKNRDEPKKDAESSGTPRR
ncbi:MAG: hypothetical protein RRC34_16770 [Lentisphaeria bacterium]|nr:hypothetical protein [Lentisphaeria bacterium]